MKLSYSKISTYQNCPLQYRFRYVEGRPSVPSPALSFGKSVHAALEWLYSGPTAEFPAVDELINRLEVVWEGEGYSSSAEEARYFYQAKAALEMYYRNNVLAASEDFKLPAAVEYKFRVDLGFCDLTGVIDRLDRDEDGGYEVIDYKTNRRLPPAKRLRDDLQLPLYHLAAQRTWEISVNRVTFHYLLLDHRFTYSVTPQRLDEALAEVERVARSIEFEQFDPCRNNLCPWCDYLADCPLMAGKIQPKRSSSPALDIGQAVDELVSTHIEVSNKLARVEGLKEIITSYMHEKGVERIGGSHSVAYLDEEGCLTWEESSLRLFE